MIDGTECIPTDTDRGGRRSRSVSCTYCAAVRNPQRCVLTSLTTTMLGKVRVPTMHQVVYRVLGTGPQVLSRYYTSDKGLAMAWG